MKSSGARTAELIFGNVGREDTGMYTCEANNSFGRTEKQLSFVVNCEYFLQLVTFHNVLFILKEDFCDTGAALYQLSQLGAGR